MRSHFHVVYPPWRERRAVPSAVAHLLLARRMLRRALIVLLATAASVTAQDHLEPGEAFANLGKYPEYVRRVLAGGYSKDVVLRVLLLPSFSPEEVAGIRKRNQEYDAFCITPRTAVWDTYTIKEKESGEIRVFDVNGKRVTPQKNKDLLDLKKRAPSDYQHIKIQRWSTPIPASVAERVIRLWRQMLLDARPGADERVGVDGETYEFAMPLNGRSVLTAEVWSPEKGTRTEALVMVAHALSQFARGSMDTQELIKRLKSLESRIRSNQAMQRTAGRSAFTLLMTSTFNLQPHAPSPAVADLVSR